MQRKIFNIHNLIRLEVETKIPSKMQQLMHHMAEFEEKNNAGSKPDILIKDYDQLPSRKYGTVVSDSYFYEDGYMNIPDHKLCFNLISPAIEMYCDRIALPATFLTHLALLRKDYVMIHSAGVEFKGKKRLFCAFGGIGKTIMVAGVVHSGGKLFGDDMNIIGHDQILGYPQDFSVYPYHLPVLKYSTPEIVRKFKNTAVLDRVTDVLERYQARPIKLTRIVLNTLKTFSVNIPPRSIFGNNFLASSGKLDEVYFLTRLANNLDHLTEEKADPSMVARVSANILLHEWHESLGFVYAYSALSGFSWKDMFVKTQEIMERALSGRPCTTIGIPTTMPAKEYQEKLLTLLSR